MLSRMASTGLLRSLCTPKNIVTGAIATGLTAWYMDGRTPPPGDPFDLDHRFVTKHRQVAEKARQEIAAGAKESHWSWFVWPTPPYVGSLGGVEVELSMSPINREYALRDPPPNHLRGDEAAVAYLTFPESEDGISLRRNYIEIMQLVAEKLEGGADPITLIGVMDLPKIESSLELFERASRQINDSEVNQVCIRTLRALGK